jgi:Family of unknown function (DUF6507)
MIGTPTGEGRNELVANLEAGVAPPPDLKVDLSLLESTAGSLGMLTEEFKNAKTIVEGYDSAVGSHTVTDALHNFAGNWKVHRDDLLKKMDAVYQMATKSHEAYVNADDKLAQDITKATHSETQHVGGPR